MDIEDLKSEIKNCKICASRFMHSPNPITYFNSEAKIIIIGQAPGNRAHQSDTPWNDKSGDRLRGWLGVDRDKFYNNKLIAIMPMGFCYPGINKNGGDNPPSKICAPTWHNKIKLFLPNAKLTLLIGSYAMKYYLKNNMKTNMTETIKNWREYLPEFFTLPHPSWRNTSWLKKNSWFEEEVIPNLQETIKKDLKCP